MRELSVIDDVDVVDVDVDIGLFVFAVELADELFGRDVSSVVGVDGCVGVFRHEVLVPLSDGSRFLCGIFNSFDGFSNLFDVRS